MNEDIRDKFSGKFSEIFLRDKTVWERFFNKVSRVGDCWEWTGNRSHRNYGYFRFENKNCTAHRASYRMFKGEVPSGLEIDHLCRNSPCVNPEHLEAVTKEENVRRQYNGRNIDGKCSIAECNTRRRAYTYKGKVYYNKYCTRHSLPKDRIKITLSRPYVRLKRRKTDILNDSNKPKSPTTIE